MIQKSTQKTLIKNILNSLFGEIIRQLKYKTEFKGKKFYQVETYYLSDQICSNCGNRDERFKDYGRE